MDYQDGDFTGAGASNAVSFDSPVGSILHAVHFLRLTNRRHATVKGHTGSK